MNILICDDIQVKADALNKLITASGFKINTVVFNNARDTLNCIRLNAVVDVCILDIVMPEMSGISQHPVSIVGSSCTRLK